jgi:hypothetical protein
MGRGRSNLPQRGYARSFAELLLSPYVELTTAALLWRWTIALIVLLLFTHRVFSGNR